MTTTPPAKRSVELRRTNTFPTEMASRSLVDAFQKERGARSEQKKSSSNRLGDDFEDSDCEESSSQAFIGKRPKNVRRTMICFSSVFLPIAVFVGTVPNLASLWSLHLIDFIWDAPTMSTGSKDDQRFLFRSPHDDKIMKSVETNQSIEHTRVSQRRPKLVIHMGPHKTASTTLQADLTLYQDRLQLDNYLYLGRLYHPFTRDGKFFVNRTPDSKLQTYFRDMFAKCWRGRYVAANKALCVTDLRDALLKTYGSPTGTKLPNLLISDEALLKLFHDGDTNTTTQNEHYVMLTKILSRDWDIVLTVAYRRFFEWLPSAKYQKDKPNGRRQSTAWPNTDPNMRAFTETGGGIPPQPLFAVPSSSDEDNVGFEEKKFAEWRLDHFMSERTISTIRNITSSTAFSNTSATPIQLRIYHLYGKLSIRTHFLCKVLPHANNACKASRRDEILPHSEIRINARNDDTLSCPLSYFDALAVAAASPPVALIDTTVWKRQKVANLLRKHYIAVSLAWHEEEINRKMMVSLKESDGRYLEDDRTRLDDDEGASANNVHDDGPPILEATNPWELPLKCPTSSQLEQLLHLSLSLEARHLPKLYRKSVDEHRASFYKAVAESPTDYCWVDTDFLLSRDSLWKNHISKVFSVP